MRKLLCTVAWFVAVAAALVTVPTAWVATHVADEDGYAAFSGPLASDPELQSAFAAYFSDYLVREAGLPSELQPAATTVLTQAAGRTANAPGFSEAWEKTQRRSHRMVFGPSSEQDRLAVDLGPMASFIARRVSDALPFDVAAPERLIVPVNGAPEREAIDQVEATPERSRIGLIVVVVAALAVLLFARRRSVALAWLGVGAVAVAAALRVASGAGVPAILDRTEAPSPFARTLQKLLAERATDSLAEWLVWIAAAGAAAIVLGLVGRIASGRSTQR